MTAKAKGRLALLAPVLLFFIGVSSVSVFWLQEYRSAAFVHISEFCEIMIEEDPGVETQVFSAVKKYHLYAEPELKRGGLLTQYGYRSSEFCEGIPWRLLGPSSVLFFATVWGFLLFAWYMNRHSRRRIEELLNYLEQVNTGTEGTMIQTREDEFSRLQDEMYKTVTALYQTREAAVKAKLNFADNLGNIAHQIKTPITAAFLSLQLMEKKMPNVYAKQTVRQLERLNRLEESLLTLSRLDAGVLPLERSRVDIYTALSLAAENLKDLLVKKNLSVSVPDKGCVEIDGDLEWTMEALMNLMKNCMEHSPQGGLIHCDYSCNPLYTEILIWDDGEGFCSEDIPRLFERFYRGRGAAGNGIGIGLSLARSIFELQNGSITARNLPQGGACFEVRIYF